MAWSRDSGTIVRQAVAFSALIGQPVHIVHARTRRPKPGLGHQHIRVVQAIGELVNGTAEGLSPGVPRDYPSARNAQDRADATCATSAPDHGHADSREP